MPNPYDNAPPKKISILGPTLKFKGELSAEEDLLIHGEVEGSITHNQSVTVGEGGRIKAEIRAAYITIEGTVEGNLQGSKAVLIRETGDVRGNIYSPTVSLVDGAHFKGKIDMEDPRSIGEDRPAKETGTVQTVRTGTK